MQVDDILKSLSLAPAKLYNIFVPKSGADIIRNDLVFIQKLFGLDNVKGSKNQQQGEGASSSNSRAPLQVTAICPHHGPAVQSIISQLLLSYDEWIKSQIELVKLAQVRATMAQPSSFLFVFDVVAFLKC